MFMSWVVFRWTSHVVLSHVLVTFCLRYWMCVIWLDWQRWWVCHTVCLSWIIHFVLHLHIPWQYFVLHLHIPWQYSVAAVASVYTLFSTYIFPDNTLSLQWRQCIRWHVHLHIPWQYSVAAVASVYTLFSTYIFPDNTLSLQWRQCIRCSPLTYSLTILCRCSGVSVYVDMSTYIFPDNTLSLQWRQCIRWHVHLHIPWQYSVAAVASVYTLTCPLTYSLTIVASVYTLFSTYIFPDNTLSLQWRQCIRWHVHLHIPWQYSVAAVASVYTRQFPTRRWLSAAVWCCQLRPPAAVPSSGSPPSADWTDSLWPCHQQDLNSVKWNSYIPEYYIHIKGILEYD